MTHVKVLKRLAHRTLVEVQLETGPQAPDSSASGGTGHPIAGDRAYGSQTNPIRRLALHAAKLAFKHPRTGRLLEFVAASPTIFASLT